MFYVHFNQFWSFSEMTAMDVVIYGLGKFAIGLSVCFGIFIATLLTFYIFQIWAKVRVKINNQGTQTNHYADWF